MKKIANYKYIAAGIAVIFVILLCYLVYLVFDLHGMIYEPISEGKKGIDEINEKKGNETPGGEDDIVDGSILNVLLVGIDSEDANGRSDTIMIARYNKANNEVGLVSIPRDTRVKLPKRGYEKINHAYVYGGVSYLKRTLENFLDIKIHNYVMVDFTGFKNVVDIVDGVEMYVEQDMYYYDDALDEVIVDLQEGKQVLDGDEALGYVRWRGGPDADIGRVQRQQKFLKEMIDEVFKIGSLPKIRGLAGEVTDNVVMDFSFSEIISLTFSFNRIDWDNMTTEVLPGENKRIDGLWYYEVEKEKAQEKTENLIE